MRSFESLSDIGAAKNRSVPAAERALNRDLPSAMSNCEALGVIDDALPSLFDMAFLPGLREVAYPESRVDDSTAYLGSSLGCIQGVMLRRKYPIR